MDGKIKHLTDIEEVEFAKMRTYPGCTSMEERIAEKFLLQELKKDRIQEGFERGIRTTFH